MALVEKHASIMVKDADAPVELLKIALEIVKDDDTLAMLAKNIKTMARPDASEHIVDEIEKLISKDKE